MVESPFLKVLLCVDVVFGDMMDLAVLMVGPYDLEGLFHPTVLLSLYSRGVDLGQKPLISES